MVTMLYQIAPRHPAFQSLEAREVALKDASGRVLQLLVVRPLSPTLHAYEVFATSLPLARIALVVDLSSPLDERGLWQCDCGKRRASQYHVLEHAYYTHHVASSQRAGVATSQIAPTGDVRIGERRSRMPWRVHAPEYD